MIGCVVIADDLTGANAAGVLMTKAGFRTYSLTYQDKPESQNLEDCQCIVYPTASRSISAEGAYERVYRAVKTFKFPDVRVYAKRIDTTLRGNLGTETDAMLDALGDNRTAMVVPCFPSSGRINVGGYLLVHGIPLHKTEAAADPKTPVHTPCCGELFKTQSKYPVDSIMLKDLMRGPDFTAEKIKSLAGRGVRNIIFDSVTEEDIDLVAEAVASSGVSFIAVDPGVFTAALSRKLMVPVSGPGEGGKIFVAVGSVNAVARRQVDRFLASCGVYHVYMETREFLESEERRRQEIDRAAGEILANCGAYDLCSIVGRGIIPEYRVPLEPYAEKTGASLDELSNIINRSVAEICHRVITADRNFMGLYTCGGDITIAVCERLGNLGIRLLGEVLPLASYGVCLGGERDGLKMVTKGGMVGDDDAIVRCVQYLRDKMNLTRPEAPPRGQVLGS